MKTLLLISTLSLLVGCASPRVHVSVNSVKNEDIPYKLPMIFPKLAASIESEKIRKQCAKGARSAGFNVVDTCYENCHWATVSGKTGDTRETTSSFYNSYTKQVQYAASDETARQIKISIFNSPDLKSPIWEVVLDSSGSTSNVLGVASEMCEAGLITFPREVTNRNLAIDIKN